MGHLFIYQVFEVEKKQWKAFFCLFHTSLDTLLHYVTDSIDIFSSIFDAPNIPVQPFFSCCNKLLTLQYRLLQLWFYISTKIMTFISGIKGKWCLSVEMTKYQKVDVSSDFMSRVLFIHERQGILTEVQQSG